MSLLFLYKPHCFFDLGLVLPRDSSNKHRGLTKEPMPEPKLPVITKDAVSQVFNAAMEAEAEEELMITFLML